MFCLFLVIWSQFSGTVPYAGPSKLSRICQHPQHILHCRVQSYLSASYVTGRVYGREPDRRSYLVFIFSCCPLVCPHSPMIYLRSHPPLTTLTNEQIIAELGWTKKVIKDVLGVTPNMMRPPYGDVE